MITALLLATFDRQTPLSFRQRLKYHTWYNEQPYRAIAMDCLGYDLIDKLNTADEDERVLIAFNTVKDMELTECVKYVISREFNFDIQRA